MADMRPPTIPDKRPAVMTEDEDGGSSGLPRGATSSPLSDTAVVRLLADTGMRASELIGIRVGDLDLEADTVLVLGKGPPAARVPLRSEDGAGHRPLPARPRRPSAGPPTRAVARPNGAAEHERPVAAAPDPREQAGVDGVHPHRFRHFFAHSFLAGGGQEGELANLAGWRSMQMIRRYAASTAADRARDALRRPAIGDRL